MSEQRTVEISVELSEPGVAMQLAQFCKRSTFDIFYELTEAHLTKEERTETAYQMIAGIEAVARALADKGYSPR